MAKEKMSSSDLTQSAGCPTAEANFWTVFNAEAKAEISISASIVSADATGVTLAFYGTRCIATVFQSNYSLGYSEFFPLEHEIFTIKKKFQRTKVALRVAKMDTQALKTELEAVTTEIDDLEADIAALSLNV